MKKKISILITSLSGGGAERVVSILLYELSYDYDITLVLMNDTIVYDIPKDTEIVYLENTDTKQSRIKKILKLPYLGWKYKRICEEKKFDVSLSFMYRPNFINIFAKIFGLRARFIISERNTPSMIYKGSSFSSTVGRFLVQRLYPKADLIIPNSKGNAFDLIQNFFIPKEKVQVIENPFDISKIERLASENDDIKKNEKFVFLTVGRFEAHKSLSLVIKAFANLNNDNCELWLIGQGPKEKELKELVKKLGLTESVKLLGFDKNPFKYMSKADCFVLASTREGFPNVIVEALACGLPVISSDCHSGPREILAPSNGILKKLKDDIEITEYGALFPVNDEILLYDVMKLFFEDVKLYKSLKDKSKHRASYFEIVKIIEKFKKII